MTMAGFNKRTLDKYGIPYIIKEVDYPGAPKFKIFSALQSKVMPLLIKNNKDESQKALRLIVENDKLANPSDVAQYLVGTSGTITLY